MTTNKPSLAPSIEKKKENTIPFDREEQEYLRGLEEGATLQAEYDMERVRKAIDDMIKTMDSFYDGGIYIGNIDFIKELPKKGEMIEARIHALMLLKKELGIEQEENSIDKNYESVVEEARKTNYWAKDRKSSLTTKVGQSDTADISFYQSDADTSFYDTRNDKSKKSHICKTCKKEITSKLILSCSCGQFCSQKCQDELHEKNPRQVLEKALNTYFPKGDKRRGDALVLFAIAQLEIDKLEKQELAFLENHLTFIRESVLCIGEMKRRYEKG